MTINEAIKIVENMIDTLRYTDDVFIYDYEEDALKTLIKASQDFEVLKGIIGIVEKQREKRADWLSFLILLLTNKYGYAIIK